MNKTIEILEIEAVYQQGVVCYVVVNAQVDVVRHVEMAVV